MRLHSLRRHGTLVLVVAFASLGGCSIGGGTLSCEQRGLDDCPDDGGSAATPVTWVGDGGSVALGGAWDEGALLAWLDAGRVDVPELRGGTVVLTMPEPADGPATAEVFASVLLVLPQPADAADGPVTVELPLTPFDREPALDGTAFFVAFRTAPIEVTVAADGSATGARSWAVPLTRRQDETARRLPELATTELELRAVDGADTRLLTVTTTYPGAPPLALSATLRRHDGPLRAPRVRVAVGGPADGTAPTPGTGGTLELSLATTAAIQGTTASVQPWLVVEPNRCDCPPTPVFPGQGAAACPWAELGLRPAVGLVTAPGDAPLHWTQPGPAATAPVAGTHATLAVEALAVPCTEATELLRSSDYRLRLRHQP